VLAAKGVSRAEALAQELAQPARGASVEDSIAAAVLALAFGSTRSRNGRAQLKKVSTTWQELEASSFEELTHAEQETLSRLLAKVRESLER
jgi:hypothetical protein